MTLARPWNQTSENFLFELLTLDATTGAGTSGDPAKQSAHRAYNSRNGPLILHFSLGLRAVPGGPGITDPGYNSRHLTLEER